MAALGTVELRDPFPVATATRIPISDYNIIRGKYLGVIVERDPGYPLRFGMTGDVGTYIVRQIRVLYRQLWPSHGQRFPQ